MKFLLAFCVGVIGFAKFSDSVAQTEYWFTAPNGVKIVHHPIDSMLVVEFEKSASEDRKKYLLEQNGLRLLPLPCKRDFHKPEYEPQADWICAQTLADTTLIVGVKPESSAMVRRELGSKYAREVKGVLPAFSEGRSKTAFYLSPILLGVIFYENVTQSQGAALIAKHNLVLSQKEHEDFFERFYIKRFAHLRLNPNQNLFEMIRLLQQEPEVYAAFPLCVDYREPSHLYPWQLYMPENRDLKRHARVEWHTNTAKSLPPFFRRLGRHLSSELRHLYWLSKTATPDMITEYISDTFYPVSGDSIEVTVRIKIVSDDDLQKFIRRNELRPVEPAIYINDKDEWYIKAMMRWQDLERVISSDELARIHHSAGLAAGTLDTR